MEKKRKKQDGKEKQKDKENDSHLITSHRNLLYRTSQVFHLNQGFNNKVCGLNNRLRRYWVNGSNPNIRLYFVV